MCWTKVAPVKGSLDGRALLELERGRWDWGVRVDVGVLFECSFREYRVHDITDLSDLHMILQLLLQSDRIL